MSPGGQFRMSLDTATAGLTHTNPVGRAHARPRLFGLVDERLQQPGAITIPTLAVVADRPDDPAQHVRGQVAARNTGGAPAAGTGPTPGADGRAGPYRPTRPRRRGTAAAAQMPQTPRRPASHAPNPPDTAVADRRTDRRRAGARAPSACSRPSAARRSPPTPGSDSQPRRPCPVHPLPAPPDAGAPAPGPHRRERADPQAARRDRPPPSRTTPGSNSRAATGPARRANRTLHRRDRRPDRGCRHPARPRRPARRAGGRGCPAEYVRPDSESPCRPP